MNITLDYGSGEEKIELPNDGKVIDVLRDRGISPDVSIVFVGSTPIPVDSPLEEGMVLRVVSVVSGG